MTRKSKGRINYTPLPDAAPERELDALAEIFAFALKAHARKKAATSSGQEDDARKDHNAHTKESIPS